jgi:hypothetical protein
MLLVVSDFAGLPKHYAHNVGQGFYAGGGHRIGHSGMG